MTTGARGTIGLRGRLAAFFAACAVALMGGIAYLAVEDRNHDASVARERLAFGVRELAARHQLEIERAGETLEAAAQRLRFGADGRPACGTIALSVPGHGPLRLVDAQGATVCGAAVPVTWALKRALESTGPSVGDFGPDAAPGEIAFSVFRPVRDGTGRLRGVLVAPVTQAGIEGALGGASRGQLRMALVDETGTVIARHPDPEGLLGRDISTLPAVQAARAKPDHGLVDGRQGVDPGRIYAYARLGRVGGHNLTLVSSDVLDDVLAPAETRLRTVLAVMFVLVAIFFSLLWVGADAMLLRPLARLTDAARRVGEGDFTARAGTAAAGEMGRLARAFDDMAVSLGSMRATAGANRALLALVAARRARAGLPDRGALMGSVLDALVTAGGYRGAWVAIATPSDATKAETAAARGEIDPPRDPLPLEGLEGSRRDSASQGATLVVALREEAWTLGVLGVSHPDPDAFDEAERRLLEEVGADLARALVAFRDHAGLREAEEALAESRRRLVEAQRIARVGSWQAGPEPGTFAVSEEFLRMVGADAAAPPASLEAITADLRPAEAQAVAEARALSREEGTPYRVTYRLPGTGRVVEESGETRRAASGEPYAVGVLQDVTEPFELRLALRERMKELRCLYDVFRETESDERPVAEMVEAVARAIPPAWLLPESAAARIRHGGLEVATAPFGEADPAICVSFRADGQDGEVAVAYRGPMPAGRADPFLPEERTLVEAIAKRLAEAIDRRAESLARRGRETVHTAIVGQAREAIALVDPETGAMIEFNEAAWRSLGYGQDEFAEVRFTDLDAGLGPVSLREGFARMRQPGGAVIETCLRHRSGAVRDARVSARPVEALGRNCLAVLWTDITEAKRAAAQVLRANRDLRAIADATRSIVFAQDEAGLLEGVCRSVVASAGYRMAWIGFAEEGEERPLRLVAHAGVGESFAHAARFSWAEDERGSGPAGRAVRERRPVVARYLVSDPSFAPWREPALSLGLGSCIALPLLADGARAGGVLVLFAGEPDAFDDDEVSHLAGMADALGFGVRALRDRVARDEARASAQETAARLAHLIDASPGVVYTLAPDGEGYRVADVSDNVARLLGFAREAVLAPGFWVSRVHPEDLEEAKDRAHALHLRGTLEHEYRFRHGDGHYLWLRDRMRLERDAAGRPVEMMGAWHDVTTQKAAEAEIRKLSAVIEQSPSAVLITDLEANAVYVNETFTRQTGYAAEEMAGRNPRLLQSGRTPRATYEAMWAELTAGRPWRGEMVNLRKDGALHVTMASIAPLRDPAGRITHYAGVMEDITERKHVEEQLRKLVLAVEQSPESIVISDLDARIEYVNEAFLRHSGYTREEVTGRNPRVLQSGKTPRSVYEGMWAQLSRGEPWRGEFVNRRKDGTEYVEFAIIAPMRQPDGRITHYIAIKDDITDRKRMAAELERHRGHLEDLVKHRTAALAEASARAEAASVAKSAFLANMSHEIRTPLNAIIGLARLVQSSGLSDEQVSRLRKIDASAHHLLGIVNDILDLSKVEAGFLAIERVDFDLMEVVREAWGAASARAEMKGLAASLEAAPGLPAAVRSDPLRLSQVLMNLATNAVKFTEAGAIRLRVAPEPGDARAVRFEVADTGIGIAEGEQERLFRPFEQADASTTRRYGGTGLGLAICRRLVEAMNGRIGVASRPGAGSTFWFVLPMEPASGRVEQEPSPDEPAAPPPAREPSAVRLLLVEDDPINQEVAVETLRLAGYQVDVADNGAMALERAGDSDYDLILMDVQMPVMDGFEASRRLRGMPRHAATPIVAMTANVYREDRERARAVGMSDFVAKPVDPDVLFETVGRWTGARPRPAAAGPDDAPTLARVRLANLEGLDAGAGLRSVRGNWASYVRLLRTFAGRRSREAGTLAPMIAEGRLEEAQRAAHTLKGVAATLGATRVATLALAVEKRLRDGERDGPPLAADVATLEAACERLVAGLETALPPEAPPDEPPDAQAARASLRELARLLADDDVRAAAFYARHEAGLKSVIGPAAQAVGGHIAGFRFDEALAALQAAEREAGDAR